MMTKNVLLLVIIKLILIILFTLFLYYEVYFWLGAKFIQKLPWNARQSSYRVLRIRKPSFQPRQFRELTSEEIYAALINLSQLYPNFVTVSSSQAWFHLPTAGGPSDCPYEKGDEGCKNWIITIEDKLAHPGGSASFRRLPEVFISGALHGDERVGPTSAVETAKLLLMAVDCEAKQFVTKASSDTSSSTCIRKLGMMGIQSEDRKWLARLVSTRRIVIVPTTNALGYYQHDRTEDGIDPNRDFPFENNPSSCMLTITARTVNELFISHMFQQSLTFHAGVECILYQWGNPSYGTMPSPDDTAQAQIARAYSDYAGKFGNIKSYQYGKMNDLLYPVNGGMEDWAYGASWDSSLVEPCTPATYGGYQRSKTIYNSSILRTFNILVETSTQKAPATVSLGNDGNILNPKSFGNGHVPRNIRIILLMIETVEPYVRFLTVGDETLPHDIIPTRNTLCPPNYSYGFKASVSLQWTVGGAFEINRTYLVYGPKLVLSQLFNCTYSPSEKTIQSFLKDNADQVKFTKSQTGKTRWHAQGPSPVGKGSSLNVVFSAVLNLTEYRRGTELMCIALAVVDQSWSQNPSNSIPVNVMPQSHLVKARTDPTWHHKNAGREIQGRLTWFSAPLKIKVY